LVAKSFRIDAVSEPPRLGLALSGGGFRATAFGLGCLRALHDRDLIQHVRVVSGISGGSLLTAMWAYGPKDFAEFDASVVSMLRSSLQWELVWRTFTPAAIARNVTSLGASLATGRARSHTRTDSLVAALGARAFGQRTLQEVTHSNLVAVISATDLASGNAVRFGSEVSSCSPYGEITNPITVADAMAASAAYPVLLPALRRDYIFRDRSDALTTRTVVMTDGGVYDNLGLSPLLPGRSAEYTHHVYELDYLIVVDAGRGRSARKPARFWPRRMKQAFEITHTKTQDASRSRIHLAGESRQIKGFVHAYLGMKDKNLPVPLADLVAREEVEHYPTNFAKMPVASLNAISVRAEQLTRVLLAHTVPTSRSR
jgi:predicted acylesterase/phospholipase RssA